MKKFDEYVEKLDFGNVTDDQVDFISKYTNSNDKEKFVYDNLEYIKDNFPDFEIEKPSDKPISQEEMSDKVRADAWILDENSPNFYGNWSTQELNNRASSAYPNLPLKEARSKFMRDIQEKAIDYNKEKIKNKELNVSFRRSPLEWTRAKIGKIAFPELYHMAEQGEGPATWSQTLSEPAFYKDVGTDILAIEMPGSRALGRYVPTIGRNVLGRIGANVVESGAQEGIREGLSDYEALNIPEIITAGTLGGVGSAATWKGLGDMLKRVDTKATKRAGNVLENIGLHKDELAKDYVSTANKQIADKESSVMSIVDENRPLTKQDVIGPETDIKFPREVEPLHDAVAEISKGKLTTPEMMKKYPIQKVGDDYTMGVKTSKSTENYIKNVEEPKEYKKALKTIISRHKPIEEGFESITSKYQKSKPFEGLGGKSGLRKSSSLATSSIPRFGYKAKIQPDEEDIETQAITITKKYPEEVEKWKRGFSSSLTPEQKRILNNANIQKLGW